MLIQASATRDATEPGATHPWMRWRGRRSPSTLPNRNVSASIILCIYQRRPRSASELLKCADAAMYHAKGGRPRHLPGSSPPHCTRRWSACAWRTGCAARSRATELALHCAPVWGRRLRSAPRPLNALAASQPRAALPEDFVTAAGGGMRPDRAIGEVDAGRAGGRVAALPSTRAPGSRSTCGHGTRRRRLRAEGSPLGAGGEPRLPGSMLELEITERVLMSHIEQEPGHALRRLGAGRASRLTTSAPATRASPPPTPANHKLKDRPLVCRSRRLAPRTRPSCARCASAPSAEAALVGPPVWAHLAQVGLNQAFGGGVRRERSVGASTGWHAVGAIPTSFWDALCFRVDRADVDRGCGGKALHDVAVDLGISSPAIAELN